MATAIALTDFTSVLGAWSAGGRALYLGLAEAIRQAIDRNEIADRQRLPPDRILARALGVSRTTVVTAYEHLRQQGWLERRQGSGTFAVQPRPRDWRHQAETAVVLIPGTLGKDHRSPAVAPRSLSPPIEFTAAALPCHDESMLGVGSSVAALKMSARTHGYSLFGLDELRTRVAQYLTADGLPTTKDQILITSGAQQAIALSATLLVQTGGIVLMEDPTWIGAIDAYRMRHAQLVGIPIESTGIAIDRLRRSAEQSRIALIHLSPSVNNPTGILMSEGRRRAVAKLADDLGLTVIEDNTLAELVWPAQHRPSPLASFVKSASILTIGSISKLFWGGLRIGWIRASEPIISRLAEIKLVLDHGSAIPSQILALPVFDKLQAIRRARLEVSRKRLDVLTSVLNSLLPDWKWKEPDGGLAIWVQLPRGNAIEFAQFAQRNGATIVPGSACSPEQLQSQYFRIPFVHNPDVLREGVHRLHLAWRQYTAVMDDQMTRYVRV